MKTAWRWAAAFVVSGALWTGCTQHDPDESEQNNPGLDTPPTPGETNRQPTPDAGSDAGVPPLPSPTPDAGTPPSDAGTTPPDAGTTPPDAGTTPPDAGTTPPEADISFPSTPGWQFFGTQNGGPRRIYDVSTDEGGNVWVAGGEDGLYVLSPGSTMMRKLTMTDGLRPYGYMKDGSTPPGNSYLKVISVAGAEAGTVFVGYEGKPGTGNDYCESNWDGNNPDPSRYKSGDADKVVLNPDSTLTVVHYDIFSGPGVVRAEPRGREKLCNILRIAYDKATGSVWFGGNHGFARGEASYTGNNTCNGQLSCSGVMEHVHPAINATDSSGKTILLTDAYYGVAVHSSGDVFFGGANRSTRFHYGTDGNNYWKAQSETEDAPYAWNRFDIWPDKVGEPSQPGPSDRVDDNVSGMAVNGDTVWVSSFTRGLAHMDASGGNIQYLNVGETALSTVATDTTDGSVWTGARWLGVVYQVKDGAVHTYSCSDFGTRLCGSRIARINVDTSNGGHRVLVAFMGNDSTHVPGALGIYTAP